MLEPISFDKVCVNCFFFNVTLRTAVSGCVFWHVLGLRPLISPAIASSNAVWQNCLLPTRDHCFVYNDRRQNGRQADDRSSWESHFQQAFVSSSEYLYPITYFGTAWATKSYRRRNRPSGDPASQFLLYRATTYSKYVRQANRSTCTQLAVMCLSKLWGYAVWSRPSAIHVPGMHCRFQGN